VLRPEPSKIGGFRSGDESQKQKYDVEEEKVMEEEPKEIGYDSFLRPMAMMRNQS
jgi:hypothetical protein